MARRLLGVLLGVVVGAIPFINTLMATLFAFYLKKKKWGLIYGGAAFLTLVIIVIANIYNDSGYRKTFRSAFLGQLKEVSIRRDVPVDTVEMEVVLQGVLRNTTRQLIQQDKKWNDLLPHGQDSSLSGKPRAAFHELSQYLYQQYRYEVQDGKCDVVFDIPSLDGNLTAVNYIEEVADACLTEDHGHIFSAASIVALVCFIAGWVGCIRNGAELYVRPAAAAANATSVEAPVEVTYAAPAVPEQPHPLPQPYDSPPQPQQTAPPPLPASSGKVNVNTAGEDELMQLRGVNRILAKTIITERNTGGNFLDLPDLKRRVELSSEQANRIQGSVDFDAPQRRGGRVIEY